jgi:hypothetical protein
VTLDYRDRRAMSLSRTPFSFQSLIDAKRSFNDAQLEFDSTPFLSSTMSCSLCRLPFVQGPGSAAPNPKAEPPPGLMTATQHVYFDKGVGIGRHIMGAVTKLESFGELYSPITQARIISNSVSNREAETCSETSSSSFLLPSGKLMELQQVATFFYHNL